MKFSTILLFLLVTLNLIHSQTLLPTIEQNPSWAVFNSVYTGGEMEEFYNNFYLTETVDACGETWQVLWKNDHYSPDDILVGYYTERTEQIYYRTDLDCSTPENLLYDFSAEVGDTVYVQELHPVWGDISIPYEVTERGTSCYGGIERIYLRVRFEIGDPDDYNYDWYNTDWVAGIGDIRHPFKWADCVTLNDNFCHSIVSLTCLEADDQIRYSNGNQASCSYDLSHLTRIHVNGNLPDFGAEDGSNWDCAFRTLQSALAVADYGDSIWIAGSTYTPSDTGDRSRSFELVNGVKIFGGFSGVEQILDERDLITNPTYLSGEIGDMSSVLDNSFHVLYGLGVDTNTVIDGVIITKGYADELIPMNGENWRGAGALLETDADHPVIAPHFRNCTFIDNHARGFGGAIYCLAEIDRIAAPNFTNCTFERNDAFSSGVLYKSGSNLDGRPMSFISCSFTENEAFENASIFLDDVSDNYQFQNCSFVDNNALLGSAGIFLQGKRSLINIDMDHCHFLRNTGGLGSALLISSSSSSGILTKLSMQIRNSNFSENEATNGESGAIMIENIQDSIDILIENTRFVANQALSRAGGITIFNEPHSATTLNISQSLFKENIGGQAGGGAIFLTTNFGIGRSTMSTYIDNTLFINNRGAFVMEPVQDGIVSLDMRHCTTYNNGSFVITKTWSEALLDTNNINSQAYLENNIFWEEEASLDRIFYNGELDLNNIYLFGLKNNFIHATSCDVEGCNEVDLGGNVFSTDENAPLFVDILNEDFRLRSCSPAINSGYTTGTLGVNISEDFSGAVRILEDTVDIGAFERLSFNLASHVTIINTTGENNSNGSIRIDSLTGGTPPYILNWENGSNSLELMELPIGSYTLTITDAEDCQSSFTYEVDEIVSTINLSDETIKLFPNPLSQGKSLSLAIEREIASIELFAINGKSIWTGDAVQLYIYSSYLSSGTYFIKITDMDGYSLWRQLVVQ